MQPFLGDGGRRSGAPAGPCLHSTLYLALVQGRGHSGLQMGAVSS